MSGWVGKGGRGGGSLFTDAPLENAYVHGLLRMNFCLVILWLAA